MDRGQIDVGWGGSCALGSWVWCDRSFFFFFFKQGSKSHQAGVASVLSVRCGGSCVGVQGSWLFVQSPGGATAAEGLGSVGRGRTDPEFAQAGGAGRGGS